MSLHKEWRAGKSRINTPSGMYKRHAYLSAEVTTDRTFSLRSVKKITSRPVHLFVCLFGEGARARSIVAKASGMAQKIIARTSFEATRDLARPDNTALLGAAPLP